MLVLTSLRFGVGWLRLALDVPRPERVDEGNGIIPCRCRAVLGCRAVPCRGGEGSASGVYSQRRGATPSREAAWGRLRGGGGVVGGGGGGGRREDDGDWSAWPLFLSGTRRSEGDAVWPLDFLWAQRRLWLVCAGLVYSAGRFLLGARWDKDEASWVGWEAGVHTTCKPW